MTIKREFLGWSRPILHLVVEYLVDRHSESTLLDLSNVLIAVPGRRGARRLLELLVLKGEENNTPLLPPTIITAGQIPDLFINDRQPAIDDLTRKLLIADVLEDMGTVNLAPLIPDAPLQNSNSQSKFYWFQLGSYFDSLFEELNGENIPLADIVGYLNQPLETERWQKLIEINEQYQNRLLETGLTDRHGARRQALENSNLSLGHPLYLISTSDLNAITKAFLTKSTSDITALIAAPETYAGHFDKLGCLIHEKWLDEEIDVKESQLLRCNRTKDEGEAIAEFIAHLSISSPELLTIGLGSENLAPYVEESLVSKGISVREAVGSKLSTTPLFKFLESITQFITTNEYRDFASLFRSHHFCNWVARSLDDSSLNYTKLVALCDRYAASHLQDSVKGEIFGDSNYANQLRDIYKIFRELISPLLSRERAPAQIREDISLLLVNVFGASTFHRYEKWDQEIIEASEIIESYLTKLVDSLTQIGAAVTPSDFLVTLLSLLKRENLSPSPSEDAVELLGWLELALDDAPNVAVAGFNEGFIPQSINEDPLLPDGLRKQLGLISNERRYSRDAFILKGLLHGRERITLSFSKYDGEGNSLTPSRLLLAFPKEKLAERINLLLGEGRTFTLSHQRVSLSERKFELPPADIKSIKATSFKDYIRCPFRYYLRHVMDLVDSTDSNYEMDPLLFGNCIHEVLAQYAASSVAGSSDHSAITSYLIKTLQSVIMHHFGESAYPALYVQSELLKDRLTRFAVLEAQRAAAGWRIQHIELKIPNYQLELSNGQRITVAGRIDRIDYNESRKEWAIIDYKSSSKAERPETTHFSSTKGWIDLQLPLYYAMARHFGLKGDIHLGYCNIPSTIEDTNFSFVKWEDDKIEDAVGFARKIAEDIMAQRFWPPAELKGRSYDPFDSIVDELSRGTKQ